MARVDAQNRLKIPKELIDLFKLKQGEKVAICWDREEKNILITKLNGIEDKYCVSIKTLDDKNRIIIPRHIRELIDLDTSSELVIAVKKEQIYIFKA